MSDAPVASIRTSPSARTLVRWGVTVLVLVVVAILQRDEIALLLSAGGRAIAVQAVLTGLLIGAVYGLVAMGLTLVFGVLSIVNFAHGALMTVGMYLSFTLVDRTGMDPYLTLLIVPAVLFVLGAAVQHGIINPTMGQPIENQLLLTFGVAILIENALLLAFTGTPRSVTLGYARGEIAGVEFPLRVLGAVIDLPRILAFVGALALAALLYVFLNRTRLGTAIRAVGDNARGAALVGIDVRRIFVVTFALGSAAVGAAAVLVLPLIPLEPTTGEQFNILAFVIVVLGTLGNVRGALVAGLLIGLTQEVGSVVFPGQSDLLLVFFIFVLVLFLKPEGLFGRSKT